MTTYGSNSLWLYVEGKRRDTGTTDRVYILAIGKAQNKVSRPARAIQKPISKNNWDTSDPVNRVIDLKRDIEEYTFQGFLASESTSDDAWTKRTAVKAIFDRGGVITVGYRTATITGVVTSYNIEDDSNRSDLNISGTGYNLPEKLEITFTILKGVNI